jgi:hypothetical protein
MTKTLNKQMKTTSMIFVLLVAGVSTAVSQSTFTTTDFKGKSEPALIIQLPNTTEVAEGTILQKLKETGYQPQTKGAFFWKNNKINDFYVFKNVQLPELNNLKLDLYFKVAPALSKEKDQSSVSMMVSKGYDNFVSAEEDSLTFSAAQKFLNGFVGETTQFKNNMDIETLEKSLSGSEGKLTGLQKKESEINKRITELEAELVSNKQEQGVRQSEIQDQKTRLEVLRAKIVKK